MSLGVPPAIYLADRLGSPNRFNANAIGEGRDYLIEMPIDGPCIIKIDAGIRWQRFQQHLLLLNVVSVDCHISTDTEPTIFQAKIANQLNLQPVNPFPRRVSTFLGSYTGWWSSHELWLGLGVGYMPLDVWFPVRKVGKHFEWRYSLPKWNVLGMAGVLSRRMLCVTSSHVYAFERL